MYSNITTLVYQHTFYCTLSSTYQILKTVLRIPQIGITITCMLLLGVGWGYNQNFGDSVLPFLRWALTKLRLDPLDPKFHCKISVSDLELQPLSIE